MFRMNTYNIVHITTLYCAVWYGTHALSGRLLWCMVLLWYCTYYGVNRSDEDMLVDVQYVVVYEHPARHGRLELLIDVQPVSLSSAVFILVASLGIAFVSTNRLGVLLYSNGQTLKTLWKTTPFRRQNITS